MLVLAALLVVATTWAPAATPPARSHAAAAAGQRRDALSPEEIERFLQANDVQRLPFFSTMNAARRCLGGKVEALDACLAAGARAQACETSVPQCATAAEQAWQLYISHYLHLLEQVAAEKPAPSERAWEAYLAAECSLQQSVFADDDIAMRETVAATCRAEKAMDRALELRDTLINAGG